MRSSGRRQSTLGFEQTLMYGHYTEELAVFARKVALAQSDIRSRSRISRYRTEKRHGRFLPKLTAFGSVIWRNTFAKFGEDWLFLALLGIIMAIISFGMDYIIQQCYKTRIWIYQELVGEALPMRYLAWTMFPLSLILFSAGFSQIVSPQSIGSGIPEMKTILRGVILYEYLNFRTLVAKIIGLSCSLGSGLSLGKEGPFVHLASLVSTLLSKLVSSFKRIYENESRTDEMLAAACAVGVASTFYSPIGGVLFSIEVTSAFFPVRNYWRGFFAACCSAAVWRLFAVWFKNEAAITALFKTNFRSDFPFDPWELFAFALMGVIAGFGAAAYVKLHRAIVHFFRSRKKLNALLQKNRFYYPTLITMIVTTITFPPFIGQFMAEPLSNFELVEDFFSNVTWGDYQPGPLSNDTTRLKMMSHWSTDYTGIFINLIIYIFTMPWISLLASTIPVPCGMFIPVFKIGAAFGRLTGEFMAFLFPLGIKFGGSRIPIVPGGYSVVGAAAFSGAVTHTISTSVIAFELTGQMTHMIPVIISVLIANAIAQTVELSIYDSIIQIKRLPFLPPISSTSSSAHDIFVEEIMVRDIVHVWRNCTYRDLREILAANPQLQSFPLVDNSANMILLGSIHREQLSELAESRLSRNRRLQEVRRRHSSHPNDDDLRHLLSSTSPAKINGNNKRRMSRFEVTPVSADSPPKSILKQTISFTYSPNATITTLNSQDSPLRQAFENIFHKSLKLQVANPEKAKLERQKSEENAPTNQRRVRLPHERVIDMSPEEQLAWEEEQLNSTVDFNECVIDAAPFQLVERTNLLKAHSLFSMLGLNYAYVTSIGRLVGVVALKDLRIGIEKMNSGVLVPKHVPDASYLSSLDCDDHTITSFDSNDSDATDTQESDDNDEG